MPVRKKAVASPPSVVTLPAPELLTSDEVCALLRVSGKTLSRMRRARQINFIRRGRCYLFRRSSVDLYLAQRETKAA